MSDEKSIKEIIDERRYAKSTTPEENRKTCPKCGSFTISPKSGSISIETTGDYYCNDCHHHFDTPAAGGEC